MGPFAYELTALLHELAGVGCVERVLGSGREGEKQGTRQGSAGYLVQPKCSA